jgi:hypothetical protein
MVLLCGGLVADEYSFSTARDNRRVDPASCDDLQSCGLKSLGLECEFSLRFGWRTNLGGEKDQEE